MPEKGADLLGQLLRRYPKPADAAKAMGITPELFAVWKWRGEVPIRHWDRARDVLEGKARQVQTRAPKGVSVSDPDAIRRLMEFAHLVVTTPGFKDILLGHAWAAEDRKVVSEVIAAVEEQTD